MYNHLNYGFGCKSMQQAQLQVFLKKMECFLLKATSMRYCLIF